MGHRVRTSQLARPLRRASTCRFSMEDTRHATLRFRPPLSLDRRLRPSRATCSTAVTGLDTETAIRPTTSSASPRTSTASPWRSPASRRTSSRSTSRRARSRSRARRRPRTAERQYLHRGIAARSFERRFQLADHVEVKGADLKDGLLHIDLVRNLPERMKPRTIAIGRRRLQADRDRSLTFRIRRIARSVERCRFSSGCRIKVEQQVPPVPPSGACRRHRS